jgi:hypothetical protein
MWKPLLLSLLFFTACTAPENKSPKKYMDLKGFFEQESLRLSQTGASVDKTVSRNGRSERKKKVIPKWEAELNLFAESDVNKAAWMQSYRIAQDSNVTSYIALDNKLRTRLIKIRKNRQGVLQNLVIINRTSNNLYHSTEELVYNPGFSYRIVKKQDVFLLGSNHYEISATF